MPSTGRSAQPASLEPCGQSECVQKGLEGGVPHLGPLPQPHLCVGEHPRMGALDVCPFIPVRGVTMDECVLCAQAFGQRLAEELGVPGESPGRVAPPHLSSTAATAGTL